MQTPEPITEENKNIPHYLEPISGASHVTFAEDYEAAILAELEEHPTYIDGENRINPRDRSLYPDDPTEQLELVKGDSRTESKSDEDLIAEEFDMQMKRVMGLQCEALPSAPLTPTVLQEILDQAIPSSLSYTCWIPMEAEIIDKTAVGEYREQVPGKILRFTIEHADHFTSFLLLPDISDIGFSWYHMKTCGGGLREAMLDAEEAQRLQQIIQAEDEGILFSIPDRIKNASGLLHARLSATERSPTPDGWLTTLCERDADKSQIFDARYRATFVHQDTDTVLEIHPEKSTVEFQELQENRKKDKKEITFKGDFNDTESEVNGHTWELHFADDEVVEEIESEFEEVVTGRDIRKIMETVSDLL
jgi:hypothetical protein